jgi:hypothetical protein
MDKQQLLASIRSEREALDAAIAAMPFERMSEPLLDGGWSVKDVLPHVAAWERRIVAAVEHATGRGAGAGGQDAAEAVAGAYAAEDAPAWPEPGWTLDRVDELNERDYQANRGRALDDVLAEARETYERALRCVEGMADADLFDAQRFAWTRGHALYRFVQANTDEHYREHREQIEAKAAGTA